MTEQVLAPDVSRTEKSERQKHGRIAQRVFRSSAKDTLPLTIHHERIYILPSSRGMAFICVIAIMLMASINYGLNLGYALCFILIGLFSSCLLATYKNLVKIKFLSISAKDTFEGSDLTYTVRISEEAKRHRSSISLGNSEVSATFDAPAADVVEVALQITDVKRGIHTLGRLTVSSDYPLGLWRGWGYLHTPVHTSVYPRPESPAAEFAGFDSTTGGPNTPRVGEQEYSGLKTYENTDSPSRVAWKRVASGAGWFSKQFEAEAEQREVAIRWRDTPSHMGTEQRLSRMCGWVVRAQTENVAHTFELPDREPLSLASSQVHYETCLKALATFGHSNSDLGDRQQGQ